MAKKIQLPLVVNLTSGGFKTGTRTQSRKSNCLKSCLETEGSAHPVNNDVVPCAQPYPGPTVYKIILLHFEILFKYGDNKSGTYLPIIGNKCNIILPKCLSSF